VRAIRRSIILRRRAARGAETFVHPGWLPSRKELERIKIAGATQSEPVVPAMQFSAPMRSRN